MCCDKAIVGAFARAHTEDEIKPYIHHKIRTESIQTRQLKQDQQVGHECMYSLLGHPLPIATPK
jgi:hypothetical protein